MSEPKQWTYGREPINDDQRIKERLKPLLVQPSSICTFQVPLLNLAVSGMFSSVTALLFDLEKLVEFMSIGTLLAYTIVSASVIIMRYKPGQPEQKIKDGDDISLSSVSVQSDNSLLPHEAGKLKDDYWWLANLVGGHGESIPLMVVWFTITSVAICILISFTESRLFFQRRIIIVTLSVLIVIALLCLFIISAHKQNPSTSTFRVPWVPFIPCLSVLCNVGLMVQLNSLTWIRFTVWMIIGLLVYFLYGIKHSKEADQSKTYSMLITSTEAHRGQWGAMKPRDDSIKTEVVKEHDTGTETMKKALISSKGKEQDFSP